MEDYKGNSNVSKNKEETPKKFKPITNNVVVRKENELKRFGKQIFVEDPKAVGGNIVTQVIIPGIQKIFSDTIKNGIDWIIYGIKGTSSNRSSYSYPSYASYYNRSQPIQQTAKPSIFSINEVIFNNRGDAEEVLLTLNESIERYKMVSVGDFYDMVSQPYAYTDQKYGWTDLRDAMVVRNRDGYSIKFPRPVPLS